MNRMVVFCGSSEGFDGEVLKTAYNLGATLARKEIVLVYGGARIGLMGEVARGALEQKGEVIGVIPGFLKKKEVFHTGLTELIITKTMHERKLKMHELSDAVMALPGGFGTLEELFEVITWAQLGLHNKPIGILNINGFYDELLRMLKTMVVKGFLRQENYEMLLIHNQLDELLAMMESYIPKYTPKWIKNDQL